MQGRIAWFRLDTGEGIVTTDGGRDYPFKLPSDPYRLQGGDIVSFDVIENGRYHHADNIRLLERWVECLGKEHRPLIRQLFDTVQFVRA